MHGSVGHEGTVEGEVGAGQVAAGGWPEEELSSSRRDMSGVHVRDGPIVQGHGGWQATTPADPRAPTVATE